MWTKMLATLWPLHKQIARSQKSELAANIAVFRQNALPFDAAITIKA
jgi:hypothetical protein